MTLKPILFSLIIASLMAAGTTDHPVKGKIKTIHRTWWSDTLVYVYDAQGRVSDQHAGHNYKTTYDYRSNAIIESNNSGRKLTMFLNSRGLVDSLIDIDSARTITENKGSDGYSDRQINFGATRSFPYSGHQILGFDEISSIVVRSFITISKKFSYDDAGYIKKEKVYLDGKLQVVSDALVENGNITSYTARYPVKDTVIRNNPKTNKLDTAIFGMIDFRVSNSFDPHKINTLMSDPHFGKCSKNLLRRSVSYNGLSATPQDSTVTTFKYTFDKDVKVSVLIKSVKSTDPPEANHDSYMADTCRLTYY
jgi:polyhydroxyalkanoate synthesis regulator phasin